MNNLKLIMERFDRYTKEVVSEQKVDLVTEQCVLFAEGQINEEELRSFLVEAHGEKLAEAILDRLRNLPKSLKGAALGAGMMAGLGGMAPDVQASTPTSMTQQVGDLGAETSDLGITSDTRERSDTAFALMDVQVAFFNQAKNGTSPTGLSEKDLETYKMIKGKMDVLYQEWQAGHDSEGGQLFEHHLSTALKISIGGEKLPEDLGQLEDPAAAAAVGFIHNYAQSK
jgi:hypothetical protein